MDRVTLGTEDVVGFGDDGGDGDERTDEGVLQDGPLHEVEKVRLSIDGCKRKLVSREMMNDRTFPGLMRIQLKGNGIFFLSLSL